VACILKAVNKILSNENLGHNVSVVLCSCIIHTCQKIATGCDSVLSYTSEPKVAVESLALVLHVQEVRVSAWRPTVFTEVFVDFLSSSKQMSG
jgi:hypothetical protein